MNIKDVLHGSNLESLLNNARIAAKLSNIEWNRGLETILKTNKEYPELSQRISAKSADEVLIKWVQKYDNGYKKRISQRCSNLPGTVPDPIIDLIIGSRLSDLTVDQIVQIKYAHRLSMSAENILGHLLEEYLSEQLLPHGWHCCWGEVIKKVDFCNEDGSLLQVKNRSNSENSSSSSVRDGTDIEKWHRINAISGIYMWEQLNEINAADICSEEEFKNFVKNILQSNPAALAIESENSWLEGG